MQKLAEICIRRPVFATMLILALVVVGAAGYMHLGVDRVPSVDLPTLFIRTTLPGGAPETMESDVSQRIEEAVNTVEGLDELVTRLRAHGAELIGEMQYGDAYRLAYVRGPEGIIVALAEQLG